MQDDAAVDLKDGGAEADAAHYQDKLLLRGAAPQTRQHPQEERALAVGGGGDNPHDGGEESRGEGMDQHLSCQFVPQGVSQG
jgi:hypothetical protein